MTDRKRLIELIYSANNEFTDENITEENAVEILADYLLEHGVIVLQCKVGDIVYVPYKDSQTIEEKRVRLISIETDEIETYMKFYCKREYAFRDTDINGEVFLSREEAEKALNDRE